MTDVITQKCAKCGADVYGTNFCENCGARVASASSVLPAGAPSVSATPTGGTALRVVTLLLLLGTLLAPAIISMLPETAGLGTTQTATFATLQCLVGFFALLAAVTGNASGGAKAGGAVFALAYVGLAMTDDFTSIFYTAAFSYQLADASVYLLLFLSWAVSRPFRGPGYFGILFLAAFEFANFYITSGIYDVGGESAAILVALIDVVLVLGVIGFSALFERRSVAFNPVSAPTASEGFPNSSAGLPNGKARASLTLALIAIGLDLIGYLTPLIGSVFSICSLGLLIAAVVVGHLARREIRTTGQTGAGMALAGMLIGYIAIGLGITVLIIDVIALSTVVSSY